MSKELEKARSAALAWRIIKIAICVAVGCFAYWVKAEEGMFESVISFAAGFAVSWWAYSVLAKNRAYAEFISLYKKEMIEAALRGSCIFEEMQFEYDYGVNENAVNESGLISADNLFSNCYISGKYNGISFIQADVRNVRGERGGYTLEYDGTYAIIPTGLPDASQTNIADKDVDISYLIPGKQYKTGNAEFDQAFKVYSSDADRAAGLLPPTVIGKLMHIRQRMGGRMALTVKNGNMYIFMSRKKSPLKPGLFKKYNDDMRQDILAELSRIKLFIDAFSVEI